MGREMCEKGGVMATQQVNDMTVQKMFRTKYETSWQQEIQQRTSRILPYVTVRPGAGRGVETPYLGKAKELREYDDIFRKVEWDHTSHGKRMVKRRKFYQATPLSEDAKVDLYTLDLTVADLRRNMGAEWQREIDQIILGVMPDGQGGYRIRKTSDGVCGGALSVNYGGDEGEQTFELDLAKKGKNLIPANYKGPDTISPEEAAGLLKEKIALLRRRYMEMEAWEAGKSDKIVLNISPAQYESLLLWEESKNRNYGFQSLKKGEVNEFLGVAINVVNCLPKDEQGNRMCVAWLKSRMLFCPWKDATFRVQARPDYVDVQEQVLLKASAGATRLDDTTVFVIPCKEAAME